MSAWFYTICFRWHVCWANAHKDSLNDKCEISLSYHDIYTKNRKRKRQRTTKICNNWQVFCLLLQCHGQTSNNRIGGLRSKRRPTSVHVHFAARNHCLRAIIGPKSCAQICVKSLGKRHKGVAQPRVLFWKSHKGQKATKAKGQKRPKNLVKQWNWEEVENTVFVINHRYQIIQIKVGPKGII